MSHGVWVVAEHHAGQVHEATVEALEEARILAQGLHGELAALVLGGSGCEELALPIVHLGAERVMILEQPCFDEYVTEPYASALGELIRARGPRVVMLSHTAMGQDLAPRLAARLRAAYLADCLAVKCTPQGELETTRALYGSRVHATLRQGGDATAIATLRPGARAGKPPDPARHGEVERLSLAVQCRSGQATPRGIVKADPATIDLGEAEIVVAGGRGVGGQAGWPLVAALARCLGAAAGGSRVAYDEGCVPKDRVVGQTGKSVHARLYFAAGISGASQHMGGVRDAQLIVAINTDAAAPIMKQADLGVVGDLHEIVPILLSKLGCAGPAELPALPLHE